MKTFQQFMVEAEAYDADLMRSATVRRVKDPSERRKTVPELRRKSQKKGPSGERQPSQYKPRTKPTERSSSTQAPTQERGSAREAQLAAAKAERKKAAQARIAARKAEGSAPTTKSKELEKAGTQLISKKKPEVDKRPADQPKRPVVGMSRAKRSRITKKGERRLRDLVLQSTGKKKESELKHKYVTW